MTGQLRVLGERARSSSARALPWIAMFVTIVGARFWLIDRFGSSLPILDQWDAEGAFLLKPWMEGSLRFADLFSPHNEHRIVLSRLLVLGLFQLNGQWDAMFSMVINAIGCGVMALIFAFVLLSMFGRGYRPIILAGVTLWLALPYGQENTLWSFQSSFYFLIFFSMVALWGLLLHRPYSARWWVGAGGALVACFTLGSGFLAAFAALVMTSLRLVTKRTSPRGVVSTALVALSIAAVGWHLRPSVLLHVGFAAPSLRVGLQMFGKYLAWPFCSSSITAIAMYFPLVALGWLYVTRFSNQWNVRLRQQVELLLSIGGWVMLQAAAMSYSRAGHDLRVVSRYMDILAIGAVTNLLATVILMQMSGRRRLIKGVANGIAMLWMAAVLVGAAFLSYGQVRSQVGRQKWLHSAEQNLRAYVATRDRDYLIGAPPRAIPYPDADRLAQLLDDASIRAILPTAVRPPLPIAPARRTGNAFLLNGYPPEVAAPNYEDIWGSYSLSGNAAIGSMESTTVMPRLPYLEFEIAGYLRKGLLLYLHDVDTAKNRRIIPTTRIDEFWRAAYIGVSKHHYTVIAEDHNPENWFAFGEPRELGRFSYYAIKTCRYGLVTCSVGLLLYSTLLIARFWQIIMAIMAIMAWPLLLNIESSAPSIHDNQEACPPPCLVCSGIRSFDFAFSPRNDHNGLDFGCLATGNK